MENDILFFDGSCPLCAHEIKRLERLCDANIEFRDIHSLHDSDFSQIASLPSREDMLKRLHCQTHDRGWLVGAEANIRAWQHTSLKRWLKPLSWPGILLLVKCTYELWLIYYRFQRQRRLACPPCQRDQS